MVQVTVNEGILEGELVNNKLGGRFYSFKGIPYAEPPVGELRFKAPQPKKPWDEVRSAKKSGSVCFQIYLMLSPNPIGHEDCLYLNVYTPVLNPTKPLPVMLWIHGGAFKRGSGNDDIFGPEFLIRHGVILVTVNYRLEAFGFLCLDTEDIPGNAGLKDQVAAMRWVKHNIIKFGGDPENVTIFGVSSGAACTSCHLVSPMTKGLFKRAIVQSGSLTCCWSEIFEPRERALKLAKQLGFNSEDDKELVDFFKNVPAEDLVGFDIPVTQAAKLYSLTFAVVNEKQFGDNERFFYGDVCDLLKNGIHEGVEVMTGYTEDEGIVVYALGLTLEKLLSTANAYKEFFVPEPIMMNRSIKDHMEVGKKMKEFYFNKEKISKENLNKLHRFLSWDMFVHGTILFAKLISKKSDVYLYKLTCKSDRNLFTNLFGMTDVVGNRPVVCHGDDIFYLFPAKILQLNVDQYSASFVYIDRMTKLWTNFAKFGNPTPDASLGAKWLPYTIEKQDYMELGNELVAGTAPDAEDDVFWDSIFKEYLPSWTAQ